MNKKPIICIFAKPPEPGRVKTRLVPVLGVDVAASIARAFLVDTLDLCSKLEWADTIVATTDTRDAQLTDVSSGVPLWDQGGGDLDRRLERILNKALVRAPVAMALGSDSPGLPKERFDRVMELMSTNDAVIGPCHDGGFYLLALNRCPQGLLESVPWSQTDTCAKTVSRLERFGFKVGFLEPWFDVDRPEDLPSLLNLLHTGSIRADETYRLVKSQPTIFAQFSSPDAL